MDQHGLATLQATVIEKSLKPLVLGANGYRLSALSSVTTENLRDQKLSS